MWARLLTVRTSSTTDRRLGLLTGLFIHCTVKVVKQALHELIRTELEARINSGDLPPGARLPTEAELQQEHNVSRATAQRALNDLAQAGLVVRSRGRGTHVTDRALQVNLLRLVDPRLGSAKIPGAHRVLSAKVVPAAQALVELPGIDDETPVIQLVRLKYDAADNPFTIETQAIPFALTPGLLDEDLIHLTTREYFAANKVPIARTRVYLDAVNIDERNAQVLEIEPGLAVLRRRRLMWLANGKLAESGAHYLRPDTIEFYVDNTEPTP
jgi:GntR family transcriptional regulator